MIGVRRVLSPIVDVATIASGTGIRERRTLIKLFGRGRWRKMKGIATVETTLGEIHKAEIHWYEAHGIGKKMMKVKRYLD